jgi:release factor glutamine methyltransferase
VPDREPVQFALYEDCVIRASDPDLLPKRGSFLLAGHLPLRPGDRVLDLGTGSGLIAVLAARRGHEVVATDVVAACCACARSNAVLNGVGDRLEVRQGDLYAPVAADAFDLIAANPAQMPTPPGYGWEDAAAYADNGGSDGWMLLAPIIREAPAHLKPGGRLVFTLFAFLGVERALARVRESGLAPAVLGREEQPFPRIARERLAYLRTLPGADSPEAGCPARCLRLVLCGERSP